MKRSQGSGWSDKFLSLASSKDGGYRSSWSYLEDKAWIKEREGQNSFRVFVMELPKDHKILEVNINPPMIGNQKDKAVFRYKKLDPIFQNQGFYYCDGMGERDSYLAEGDSVSIFLPNNGQKEKAIFSVGGCWELVQKFPPI